MYKIFSTTLVVALSLLIVTTTTFAQNHHKSPHKKIKKTSATDKKSDVPHPFAGIPAHKLWGKIYDTQSKQLITFDQLMAKLQSARIVYVGEQHNHPGHHRVQGKILKTLHSRQSVLAVGMEFLDHRAQPHLDDYTAGKITEKEMLARTQYKKRWGFPYEMYAPLFRYPAKHKLPIRALNVPRKVVRNIAKKGLDKLSYLDLLDLPAIDLTNREHRAVFMKSMGAMHKGAPTSSYEKYYQAMCVWDEAMAQAITDYFRTRRDPQLRMVVFAGSGHIRYRHGIPERAFRRLRVGYKTVIPHSVKAHGKVSTKVLSSKFGDFIWFTKPLPPKKKKPHRLAGENKKLRGQVEKLQGQVEKQNHLIKALQKRLEMLEKAMKKSEK